MESLDPKNHTCPQKWLLDCAPHTAWQGDTLSPQAMLVLATGCPMVKVLRYTALVPTVSIPLAFLYAVHVQVSRPDVPRRRGIPLTCPNQSALAEELELSQPWVHKILKAKTRKVAPYLIDAVTARLAFGIPIPERLIAWAAWGEPHFRALLDMDPTVMDGLGGGPGPDVPLMEPLTAEEQAAYEERQP